MWPTANALCRRRLLTARAKVLTHISISMMPVTVGSCRSMSSEGGHTAPPGMLKARSGPVRVMGWSPMPSHPYHFSSLSAPVMWGTAAQAAHHERGVQHGSEEQRDALAGAQQVAADVCLQQALVGGRA